jgi:pyruvate carboxylase
MENYTIDTAWFDEGGYCQVYPIKNHKHLVFKEFSNKARAKNSYMINKKLAKYDLAPKIFGKIQKLKYTYGGIEITTDWGYITDYAKTHEAKTKISMKQIQSLVINIENNTGLKFWDCHYYNVGLIKRGRSQKLVCIDTGKESFEPTANAWGNPDPGPKCSYCNKYLCKCE